MIDYGLTVCGNNAITASVLAILAVATTRLWRNAPLAHLLWLVVLVKLVTPPALGMLMAISLLRPAGTDVQIDSTIGRVPAAERQEPPMTDLRDLETEESRVNGGSDSTARAGGTSSLGTADADADASSIAMTSKTIWFNAVLIVWIAGFCVILAAAWLRIARFHRVIARAPLAQPALRDDVARIALLIGLRSVPEVRVSGARVGPLVIALGRQATLLLPETLLASLNEDERSTVIAHELAHLRRRDHWVSWFALLSVSFYWWHPVAWIARRELSRAADACCDGWVAQLVSGQNPLLCGRHDQDGGFFDERCAAAPGSRGRLRPFGTDEHQNCDGHCKPNELPIAIPASLRLIRDIVALAARFSFFCPGGQSSTRFERRDIGRHQLSARGGAISLATKTARERVWNASRTALVGGLRCRL